MYVAQVFIESLAV